MICAAILSGIGPCAEPAGENIIKVVLGGTSRKGAYIAMPSLARKLTDAQIAEITNCVRTSWGNAAQANATADGVAKLRNSAG